MKSVALHNLGCKVNGYEMDVMQQILQEKNYKIVPFDEQADIYIVNTCTVTNIADRKSRQMLHKAKKKNPEAVVVAVGCYVQTGGENVLQDGGIDLAVGNDRKKDLVEILEAFLAERENGAKEEKEEVSSRKTLHHTTVTDIGKVTEYRNMHLKNTGGHTRAYIKIQDGCNQFCSYCIIPYARGRARSRKEEDILEEIKGLAEKGCKEAVLTGIHISSYGTDKGEASLLRLIQEVHEIEGIERIRLGSLEPRIITEEFASGLGKMPKLCPHFHLSLQSGCDATLKRMNRHYTAREYYEKVRILRRVFDNPAITADVIVGFPGETEEEFAETREFLEKLKLYEMHIFKYSRREGTRAAAMKNQIADEIKAARSNLLFAMEERHSREFREKFLGKEQEVLFEEEKNIGGTLFQVGHTRQYVKVAKKSEKLLSNELITGKIVDFLSNDMMLLE